MADKRTYRERSGNVVGASEDNIDRQRLKKTRPGFFKDEPHTQESMMRGLEEAEVAEKGMVGRALNRLKTNVMGSAVDNELAGESLKRAGYKAGGKVKSASARADGCAIRGKTRA
jgi:hypothetical protein